MRYQILLGMVLSGTASQLVAQTGLPTLTPPLRIGAAGPTLGRIGYAAIATDGSTVLADDANERLYRFRPNGVLRDSIGRRGSGPGEFRVLAGVLIGPAGEVVAADLTQRRLVRWSAEGKPAGETPITGGSPLSLDEWREGPVVAITDFAGSLRFVEFRNGQPLKVVGMLSTTMPPGSNPSLGCDLCPSVALPDGHRLMTTTRDSSYRLQEFTGEGAVVRAWSRPPTAPRKRNTDELEQLGARLQQGPRGAANSPERVPRTTDLERFRYPPRIQAIQRDGQGRIWVLANHASSPHPIFDLFGAEGKFLGTINPSQPLVSFRIANDRLVAWGETGDGEAAAWVFRIVR